VEAENILLGPVLTEKASTATEKLQQIAFNVAVDANKYTIRDAVQSTYGVTVTNVRTMVVAGKLKRRGSSMGRRPKWKKALVTLQQGDKIDFYATE